MFLDAHVHLPSPQWSGHDAPFDSAASAVDYLRAAGTGGAIFNTWQGVLHETLADMNTANAAALDLARDYENFLYPGAVIHPAFPEASRDWLRRFRGQGFLWVGELVNYKLPYRYNDAEFLELCGICADYGHILQLHVHEDIIEAAQKFPSLRLVCSHIVPDLCPALAAQPNIWLDISGSAGGLCIGMIEKAYRIFGAARLLYGTDFTGYEPRGFQERLKIAVPDAEHREMIARRNVLRLLESAGAVWPGQTGTE